MRKQALSKSCNEYYDDATMEKFLKLQENYNELNDEEKKKYHDMKTKIKDEYIY